MNFVVRLCSEGIQAEMDGRPGDAKRLYERAWQSSTSDYEACIAAHYLARQQSSEEDAFRWNREALERARRVDDVLVGGFYASLYLNLGHSYEQLDDPIEARECYELALEHLRALPEDSYGGTVRNALIRGLARTEPGDDRDAG